MGSALLFFTSSSGHGQFQKKKEKVIKRLSRTFSPLDIYESKTKEDGETKLQEAMSLYDAILIIGGDGTFHTAVNIAAHYERPPILGYINNGTLGDVGRSYGVSSSLSKALRIIEEGYVLSSDLVLANEEAFAYMGAIGAYSGISYQTKRNRKKHFHRFSYYFAAMKEAFTPRKVNYSIEVNSTKIEGTSPFLMVLNGRYVGGFPINKKASFHDGKAELYITPKGWFNGLLPYFFQPKKIQRIPFAEATISVDEETVWCLDGEKSFSGPVRLKVLPSKIRIFVSKKVYEQQK
ncbi:MAG: diacylglycerol kinase family protein [Candidatus Enteromonas sp.]|nr:diacylglycerol kinase family protein [Candidatus Enteromonas sp.]